MGICTTSFIKFCGLLDWANGVVLATINVGGVATQFGIILGPQRLLTRSVHKAADTVANNYASSKNGFR